MEHSQADIESAGCFTSDAPQPINMFWTGGWDSSFRLMYALIVEGETVQPLYVLDTGRPSTLRELETREAMKAAIVARYPEIKDRFLPSIVRIKSDIAANEGITALFQSLKGTVHVGEQYEWLARFAHDFGLDDIEVCIQKHPDEHPAELQSLISANVRGIGHDCQLRSDLQNENLAVFRRFRFPVIHITKLEKDQMARQHGFADILHQSWFCHYPTPAGQPCGECIPCKVLEESNLRRDLARKTRAQRAFRRVKRMTGRARQILAAGPRAWVSELRRRLRRQG